MNTCILAMDTSSIFGQNLINLDQMDFQPEPVENNSRDPDMPLHILDRL